MNKNSVIFVSLLILFGGIFLSDLIGLWETESTKIPRQTSDGQNDPGDIRGSYSFGDIENNFDVSAEELARVFNVKTNEPKLFQVKSLEELYEGTFDNPNIEIGTASIRYYVSLKTNIKSELVLPTYLPMVGVELLLELGIITSDSDAIGWAVDLSNEITKVVDAVEEEHVEPIVKGNTTIQDLLNLNFKDSELIKLLGTDKFKRADLIKDICLDAGLEFSSIKTTISAYYYQYIFE